MTGMEHGTFVDLRFFYSPCFPPERFQNLTPKNPHKMTGEFCVPDNILLPWHMMSRVSTDPRRDTVRKGNPLMWATRWHDCGPVISAIPFTATRERETLFHLLQTRQWKYYWLEKRRVTWFLNDYRHDACFILSIVYYWLQNVILCLTYAAYDSGSRMYMYMTLFCLFWTVPSWNFERNSLVLLSRCSYAAS